MNRRIAKLTTALVCTLMLSANAQAGDGQALLGSVPDFSTLVFSVDVSSLQSHPLYAPIVGAMSADGDVAEILAGAELATGFDITTDVSTVLVAMGASEDRVVVLIEGNMDPASITTYLVGLIAAEGETVAELPHAGGTIYHEPGEQGDAAPAFTFINDGVFAVGTLGEVRAARDAAAGGSNVTGSASLSGLLGSVNSASSMWFVGALPADMMGEAEGTPMAGMESMYGALNLVGGIGADYFLNMPSDAEATALQMMLQELINAAAGDETMAAMGMGGILSATSITVEGSAVRIQATIDEATANMLYALVGGLMMSEMH